MKKRFSAPNLFLLELLIVLLIFALSAAVCVRLFVSARLTASESRALNHAVLLCESGAECFKAANGDIAKSADLLDWQYTDGQAVAYFDADWQSVAVGQAAYLVRLQALALEGPLAKAQVFAAAMDGAPLFSLNITARGAE